MYGGDDNRIIVYKNGNVAKGMEEKKSLERKTLENNLLNIGFCVHQ